MSYSLSQQRALLFSSVLLHSFIIVAAVTAPTSQAFLERIFCICGLMSLKGTETAWQNHWRCNLFETQQCES